VALGAVYLEKKKCVKKASKARRGGEVGRMGDGKQNRKRVRNKECRKKRERTSTEDREASFSKESREKKLGGLQVKDVPKKETVQKNCGYGKGSCAVRKAGKKGVRNRGGGNECRGKKA